MTITSIKKNQDLSRVLADGNPVHYSLQQLLERSVQEIFEDLANSKDAEKYQNIFNNFKNNKTKYLAALANKVKKYARSEADVKEIIKMNLVIDYCQNQFDQQVSFDEMWSLSKQYSAKEKDLAKLAAYLVAKKNEKLKDYAGEILPDQAGRTKIERSPGFEKYVVSLQHWIKVENVGRDQTEIIGQIYERSNADQIEYQDNMDKKIQLATVDKIQAQKKRLAYLQMEKPAARSPLEQSEYKNKLTKAKLAEALQPAAL